MKREFFARPENCQLPEHPKKIYLKHKNENGISRCFLKKDDETSDVLVGRIGSLSDETYENALADLKADNPVIGEKVSGGDVIFEIPVRRPLSNLVANGYVLLGDSACMTIPIIGSGIVSGLKAAKMLADAVTTADKEPFSKKNLYRYQLKFMREIGGKHAAIELVRNKLFSSRGNEIDDLVKSGVMEGLITVFADRAVNVLDAFAKEGFAPEHHLETVIFRGIVGARDRHTRAVFKVVCGKVQNRRRNAADINHFRARGGNALHEALREFGPRNAAVPAHAKGVNTRIACHRPQHQPHGIGDFRSECLTDNAADIVGFENALFGRHSIYYHH